MPNQNISRLKLGVISIISFLVIFIFIFWQLFSQVNNQSQVITIPNGASAKQVGRVLKDKNLIRSEFWFEVWVRLSGNQKSFVVGEYLIEPKQSLVRLVSYLTGSAKPSNEVVAKIIEGWSLREVGEYLKANKILSDDFTKFIKNEKLFNSLAPQELKELLGNNLPTTLEGYLFPDTYRLYKNSSSADLLKKMLNNFVTKFDKNWKVELQKNNHTVNEAVILASIVEREVRGDSDRSMVADIFWRRLKIGMALQADSTVNYITGKNTPRALFSDLEINSPYNTYKWRGLPPGPIASPSASSIKATVYPSANDFWYFLTTPEGRVIYSKTFVEHVNAKRKYYSPPLNIP